MSYSVVWSVRATSLATRYLEDDPAGLAQVLDATDLLAEDPRPVGAFPYGSEDLLRIRVGRYRILYQISSASKTITVLHAGRVG